MLNNKMYKKLNLNKEKDEEGKNEFWKFEEFRVIRSELGFLLKFKKISHEDFDFFMAILEKY